MDKFTAIIALFACSTFAYPTQTSSKVVVDDSDMDTGLLIPNNQCGYILKNKIPMTFDFQSNDTVWFFEPDLESNCGAPDSNIPCRGDMLFTGDFGSDLGYKPYTVWYNFINFGNDEQSQWVSTLRFNFNNGQTSIVTTFPCDGIEHESEINKCMFDEKLYRRDFYKYYRFKFFATCSYNYDSDTLDFILFQQSETCLDDYGNTNINKFVLASFENWNPVTYVINYDVPEFCPNCNPIETTTEVPVPTETSTGGNCKSCQDITVNVNIS